LETLEVYTRFQVFTTVKVRYDVDMGFYAASKTWEFIFLPHNVRSHFTAANN